MDALIILLGFAILSYIFIILSREVREINGVLSIIFYIGAMLFLIFVAATIYHTAMVGELVVANTTRNCSFVNLTSTEILLGNCTGSGANCSYLENITRITPYEQNCTESIGYMNSTRYTAFAVDSPILVIEILVFGIIALFMLQDIVRLIKEAKDEKGIEI